MVSRVEEKGVPVNLEAERYVLGSILLDDRAPAWPFHG